jgi:hypothetical protein
MKKIIHLLFCLLFIKSIYSQNPEWILFTSEQGINYTAAENNLIWVGTNRGGLICIDDNS